MFLSKKLFCNKGYIFLEWTGIDYNFNDPEVHIPQNYWCKKTGKKFDIKKAKFSL